MLFRSTVENAKYSPAAHSRTERGEDTHDQRETWDEMAGQYPHHPLRAVIGADDLNNAYIDGSQKRLVSRAVRLEPHFTVLDYGCGVGRWTLWFARQVKHVVGADISPKMVETARQAADEEGIHNAEHTVINGLPLPFEDSAFDLVNAVWALRYITDDDELARTVGELCRVTRPGGHVTFIEMLARSEPEFKEHEGEFSGAAVYRREGDYRSLFEGCGMTLKESTVSSASPLYWPFVAIRDVARRRNLPDSLSRLAPSAVSVSLAVDGLTTGLMQALVDRDLVWCRHRFFCFEKSETGRAPPPEHKNASF